MVTRVDDSTFKSEVLESGAVLVDFYADWCAPCKALAPAIDEVSREMAGRLKVVKVDVDEAGETAATYGVTSIPTLILFKDGREAWRRVGAAPKQALVDQLSKVV